MKIIKSHTHIPVIIPKNNYKYDKILLLTVKF